MILVFDGNPFIYRGQRFDPSKTFAGAEYLLSSLIEAVQLSKPDRAVVLVDPSGDYWRHLVYPEYKQHRRKPEMEGIRVSVRQQITHMKKVFAHLPVSLLCCPGYEADDAAWWLGDYFPNEEIMFVTIDRDWLQLITDDHSVFLFDISEKITIDNFKKFECASKPKNLDLDEFLIYKAITGDISDNIKGIRGLGPVRTYDLIKYNLEELELVMRKNGTVVTRNLLLMDMSMTPFLPFANKMYRGQLRGTGRLDIQKLRPLMIHGLWACDIELLQQLEKTNAC